MQKNVVYHELGVARGLLRLLQGYRWLLPIVVILGLMSSMLEGVSLSLLIPLLNALTDRAGSLVGKSSVALRLQNVIGIVPPRFQLLAVVVSIFVAVCLKNLIGYANVGTFAFVDSRVSHELRIRLLTRILSMSLVNVEDLSSGSLMNLLETETWRTSQALSVLFVAVTSACTAAIFVPLLFLLSWRLALFSLLSVAIIPIVVSLATRKVRALGDQAVVANTELATRMWSSLNGLRVIHNFGREAFELNRFAEASRVARDVSLRLSVILATSGPVSEVLITAIIAALALLVGAHLIDVATLSAFILILYRLQPRVRDLVSSRVALVGFEGAILAVTRFLETDVPARAGSSFPEAWRAVRFEGVTFRHNNRESPALDDVSFEISRGSTVAIVGSSGAGKSTLLDLLLGFRNAQSGRITIDGKPLEQLDGVLWRSRLAVVNQDPYVFDETVRFNILYGRPETDHKDMVHAAKLAYADSFIRALPKGYDTVVGERGVRLSGGQKQRLVLARALVRFPDVLVLDEATNALDSATEQAFQDALANFARDRTIVIVAHRLSTIQRANHIIVLHQGKLVEQGDFPSLLARNGFFARMYELQRFGQTAECGGVTAD
jgi:ATP-binding cassette, subfamily B, bacterial MsbA